MLGVQTTQDGSKQMARNVLLSQMKQASSFSECQTINTVLGTVALNMNFSMMCSSLVTPRATGHLSRVTAIGSLGISGIPPRTSVGGVAAYRWARGLDERQQGQQEHLGLAK